MQKLFLLEFNNQVTLFRTSLNRSTCPILLSILKDIEKVVTGILFLPGSMIPDSTFSGKN